MRRIICYTAREKTCQTVPASADSRMIASWKRLITGRNIATLMEHSIRTTTTSRVIYLAIYLYMGSLHQNKVASLLIETWDWDSHYLISMIWAVGSKLHQSRQKAEGASKVPLTTSSTCLTFHQMTSNLRTYTNSPHLDHSNLLERYIFNNWFIQIRETLSSIGLEICRTICWLMYRRNQTIRTKSWQYQRN